MMIKYENGTKDIFANETPKNNNNPSAPVANVAAATPAQKPPSIFANITQLGYSTGVGNVSISSSGTTDDVGPNDLGMICIRSVNGVKISDYFIFGMGVGLNYYFNEGDHATTFPLYADMRSNILGKEISPVFYFDIGTNLKLDDNAEALKGLFYEPGIGINVPGKKGGFNFTMGYSIQKSSFNFYDYYYSQHYSGTVTSKFISFKVGMSF
jgi:hypothetical protein